MTEAWREVTLGRATVRFTTRHGGVSTGPFESLNLGSAVGDHGEAVLRNRQIAIEGAGRPQPVSMRQVHGRKVVVVSAASNTTEAGECDALVTKDAGLPLLAVTADCLPIVIAAENVVAVAHAGWRGLSAGILDGVVRMVREMGGEQLRAAVGPAAGPCCYEVSTEVLESFAITPVADGRMLDLPGTAQELLIGLDVEEPTVMSSCTICDPANLFFSHRRDGPRTGRQGVVAWLNS